MVAAQIGSAVSTLIRAIGGGGHGTVVTRRRVKVNGGKCIAAKYIRVAIASPADLLTRGSTLELPGISGRGSDVV